MGHGPATSARRSRRAADLAGSRSRGRSPTRRRGRGSPTSRPVSADRAVRSASSSRRPGRRRRRFRGTDKRGGANGARIRLAPQKDGTSTAASGAAPVSRDARASQGDFNGAQSGGKKVSLADLIVLAGGASRVEMAARAAGHDVSVPFAPGRTDASQDQTDVESVAVASSPLPTASATTSSPTYLRVGPRQLLVDRAHLLTLTAPEMTVLVGGLRALDTRTSGQSEARRVHRSPRGVLNERFLRQPARTEHGVEKIREMRAFLRGNRPPDG